LEAIWLTWSLKAGTEHHAIRLVFRLSPLFKKFTLYVPLLLQSDLALEFEYYILWTQFKDKFSLIFKLLFGL
jgi:hypothetical protein